MRPPVRRWVFGLIVIALGAVVAIPLYLYADADDAPGGMVIAMAIFVGAIGAAIRIVSPGAMSRKSGLN